MKLVCHNYTLQFKDDIINISPGEYTIPLKNIIVIKTIEPKEFIQGTLEIKLKDMFGVPGDTLLFSFEGSENYQKAEKLRIRFESEKIDIILTSIEEETKTDEVDNLEIHILTPKEIKELLKQISAEDYENETFDEELTTIINKSVIPEKKYDDYGVIKCLNYTLTIDENFLSIQPKEYRIILLIIDKITVTEPGLLKQGIIRISIKDCFVKKNKYLQFAFDDIEIYYKAIQLKEYIENYNNEHTDEMDEIEHIDEIDEIEHINEIYNYKVNCLKKQETLIEDLEEFNDSLKDLARNIERAIYWNDKTAEFSDFIDVYKFDNIEDYKCYVEKLKKFNYINNDHTEKR